MSRLPRSLQPWVAELELFPDEVAASLGAMLPRLQALVGPLRGRAERSDGEPDGYDGLTRRGGYERLLMSEWVLAEEYPDEFVRRAATGEHAFFRRVRREPAAARRSLALLDVGPDQLGTPRIAQLACLILLFRRARAADVVFEWGILQDDARQLFCRVDKTTVAAWLEASLGDGSHEEHLIGWRDQLGGLERPDDLWLIGSERLNRLAVEEGASHLAIEDPLEPGVHKLQVDVVQPQRAVKSATISLPSPRLCAHLLRAPFADLSERDDQPVSDNLRLVFSSRGDYLFARLDDGRIGAFHVPNSPRAEPGPTKIFEPPVGEEALAMGWHGSFFAITHTDSELRVRGLSRGSGRYDAPDIVVPRDGRRDNDGADEPAQLRPCWGSRGREYASTAFLDPDGRLREISAGGEPGVVDDPFAAGFSADEEILDYGLASNHLIAACAVPPKSAVDPWQVRIEFWRMRGEAYAKTEKVAADSDEPFVVAAVAGHHPRAFVGAPQEEDGWAPVAVSYRPGAWQVAEPGSYLTTPHDISSRQLHTPSGAEVVGVVGARPETMLLLLEDERRKLSLVGPRKSAIVVREEAPIVAVGVSHRRPEWAWVTADGKLVVYSLRWEAELVRRDMRRAL
ncbi:MAG: hypothetical protein ACLFVJ_09865 [Persicimonas sp.]